MKKQERELSPPLPRLQPPPHHHLPMTQARREFPNLATTRAAL
jgi:hypothetical protein